MSPLHEAERLWLWQSPTLPMGEQPRHCWSSCGSRLPTSILVDGVGMGLGVETGADEGEQRQLLHFLLVG